MHCFITDFFDNITVITAHRLPGTLTEGQDYFIRHTELFLIEKNSIYLDRELIPKNTLDPIKLEHFRNLVSLSAADGKIEDVERVALTKIAYEQGIPLDRLNVMLDRAHEYRYLIPQNQTEREKQLEQMIDLALVDGDFAPAELELIHMVGEKLGFSKEEVDQIVNTYSSRPADH